MNADSEKISHVISEILSKDFRDVKILEVKVSEDVDFDGDAILRVEVVFDGMPKDLEPSILTKAIRHIRPALSDIDVFEFPSMSFVSAKDAKLSVSP